MASGPREAREGSSRGEGQGQGGVALHGGLRRRGLPPPPNPVHALQPDGGCVACSRPGTLGVYIRSHLSTLGSSGRLGQAFPYRTSHLSGTEKCSGRQGQGSNSCNRKRSAKAQRWLPWLGATAQNVQLWPSSRQGCARIPHFSPRDPQGGRREKELNQVRAPAKCLSEKQGQRHSTRASVALGASRSPGQSRVWKGGSPSAIQGPYSFTQPLLGLFMSRGLPGLWDRGDQDECSPREVALKPRSARLGLQERPGGTEKASWRW